MRPFKLFLVACLLVVSACVYDVPVTEEHNIPVSPALLGLWDIYPAEGSDEPDDEDDQLLILKFSDTEYLFQNIDGNGSMFFRVYEIEVAGISMLQMQFIGDEEDPANGGPNTNQYMVSSYEMKGDEVIIQFLNSDLVNEDIKTSEELRQAIIENKDHEELFGEQVILKRPSR